MKPLRYHALVAKGYWGDSGEALALVLILPNQVENLVINLRPRKQKLFGLLCSQEKLRKRNAIRPLRRKLKKKITLSAKTQKLFLLKTQKLFF